MTELLIAAAPSHALILSCARHAPAGPEMVRALLVIHAA